MVEGVKGEFLQISKWGMSISRSPTYKYVTSEGLATQSSEPTNHATILDKTLSGSCNSLCFSALTQFLGIFSSWVTLVLYVPQHCKMILRYHHLPMAI